MTDIAKFLLLSTSYHSLTGSLTRDFYRLSDKEVEIELEQLNINAGPLIAKVSERASALDRYAELVKRTARSLPPLRDRLRLLAIMGLVPIAVAVVCAGILFAGLVQSDNAKALAGFVILGSAGVTLLALLAAVHVAVEAYVQESLLRQRAEQTQAEVATLVRGFDLAMAFTGADIFSRFRKIQSIDALLTLTDTERNRKEEHTG